MKDVSKKQLKHFAIIMPLALGAGPGLAIPYFLDFSYPRWPWAVGLVIAITYLAKPKLLAPIYRTWMKIAEIIGTVNSWIILAIIYYLVISPTAFVLRIYNSRKNNDTTEIRTYKVQPTQLTEVF
ncbi:SxtJ family membrane protein [Pelagicoccus enzymogenes]|uniref:SxtJ family membrane protein n=1 Tax=Pelagicoccus enzymogenes TaxID=2773457 RepID=UPI00280FFE83|nr:SxtJ family membrane protein [Pelagicoccus enzymogenes]MDQ8197549.1 SxtJ family membrane protein [Pelagicoccus enzymogenes]